MNTTTTSVCPHCGKPVAAGVPLGLCPDCLLQAGLSSVAGDNAPFSSAPPPTPAELASRFPQLEIHELLGRGGMGAVYKARQIALGRLVALKILPPALGDDPAFADRFAREARALAQLNHHGIVTLYEFGRTNDGLFFFLMEFVDGMNLRQLLAGGRIAPREALAIVPELCDALQYAHDRGIVHRDIKPENILLDRRGRVKIADFGIAKLVAHEDAAPAAGEPAAHVALTEAGKVMGTPSYMAPEQTMHPGGVDHRADIYALGVVFYQMLTGELPQGKIEPPSRKVVLDVRLDEVVLRALEKEPSRRYQQASTMKTQVETIAEDQGKVPDVATRAAADGAKQDSEDEGTSVLEHAWKIVPLAAVILAFFNPWGGKAWYYFAAACAILALLPAFGFGRYKRLAVVGLALLVTTAVIFLLAPSAKWQKSGARNADSSRASGPETKPGRGPAEEILAEHDWAKAAAAGQLPGGAQVAADGRSALKIENATDAPLHVKLWEIEKPPIRAMRYAVSGEIRYEGVQGVGYLEMWSHFPQGQFFSRTLGAPGTGPMAQIAGTSGWRNSSLPFDRTGTTEAPVRIEVKLFLPARGTVFIGPLKLTQAVEAKVAIPDGAAGSADASNEPLQLRALAWLDEAPAGRGWLADGRSIKLSEIALPRRLATPAGVDVSKTRAAAEKPRFLCLWFSHPLADAQSVTKFALLDDDKRPLKTPTSDFASNATPATEENHRLGWITATVCAGSADSLPERITLQLRYSAGPWQSRDYLAADFHGVLTLANGVLVNDPGQDAKGRAFVQIVRDQTSDAGGEQWDFVAHLHDGRKLERAGRSESGSDIVQTERISFDAPLSQIARFEIRKRPIITATWSIPLQTKPPAIDFPAATFAPVIERVVKDAADLDTGKLASLPEWVASKGSITESVLDAVAWMEREGMDVCAAAPEFFGVGMRAIAQEWSQWDNLTASQVLAILDASIIKPSAYTALAPPDGTATYLIQTRDGGKGMLQILGPADNGVKIRYKLAQPAVAVPPKP